MLPHQAGGESLWCSLKDLRNVGFSHQIGGFRNFALFYSIALIKASLGNLIFLTISPTFIKVPIMHWPFSPPQSLFHKPFQRKITQLQANPVNSFPQISPNKALLMHHLTPNTWPFGQQTALPSPSPSSLLHKGVKTCPYSPQGMLGKEGLHICPKPQGETQREWDGERNIPSSTRTTERKEEGKYRERQVTDRKQKGNKRKGERWGLLSLTSERSWKETQRDGQSLLKRERFCEWEMDLVFLWSHPSLLQ